MLVTAAAVDLVVTEAAVAVLVLVAAAVVPVVPVVAAVAAVQAPRSMVEVMVADQEVHSTALVEVQLQTHPLDPSRAVSLAKSPPAAARQALS